MGLDPKFLDSLPNTLIDLYAQVEIDVLADMARRISTYDYFIPAAQHQNQKLQELGMVQEEIIKRLSALTGRTQAEIVELLTLAGEQAIADDLEYYKAADVYKPNKVDTEALYEQLNAGLVQTEGAFKNITRTTARTGAWQFIEALDRAWLQINTGAFDYSKAIRMAIIDLGEKGVGAVKYPSGRVDSIEVAVRRAIVTGANQTAIKTQEKLADQLEVELVEVTAHGGARPEHAKWQGRVFSRNGDVEIDGVKYKDLRKATRYGYADGLCGVNCRHSFNPYVPGTSRTWSDKELAKLEEKTIEYNGVKMTEYEASQKQREIERYIRKQKRIAAALDAVGEDSSAYRSKINTANKAYNDFTEQTGLKQQRERLQIAKPTMEMHRNKDYTHQRVSEENRKVISEPTYNKVIKEVTRKGAVVVRGTPEVEEHLAKSGAYAAQVGDVLLFRRDATITDVLEEVHHFNQNKRGANADKPAEIMQLLNEIGTQKYLISVAEKYKIPVEETEETKALLAMYEKRLAELEGNT